MQNSPKVSVITVVFNAVDTIEKTIQSVITQSYSNIEYIIIDGGSTDGSIDIIKKYQSKISHWVSEKDKGIYDAMNKGVNFSKGEWIYFLNSGDIFNNELLLSDLTSNFNNPDLDLFYGRVNRVYNLKVLSTSVLPLKLTKWTLYKYLGICHQAVFARRNVFQKFDLEFKLAADYDWLWQMVRKNLNIKPVDKVIANYDINGVSSNTEILRLEFLRIIKIHYGRIPMLLRSFYWQFKKIS